MKIYQEYTKEKYCGAEYADKAVVKKKLTRINLTDKQYSKGGIPVITEGNDVYIDAEDNHCLIYGATGSKKSRLFAMPLLEIFARAGESFVVTDPKGELYERTAGIVKENGYQCVVLDFRNLKQSDCWNPLKLASQLYTEGEAEKAYESLYDFAQGLGKSIHNEKDPYWENAAKDVLHGLLLLLLEHGKTSEQNIQSLLRMVDECHDRDGSIKDMDGYITNSIILPKLRILRNNSDKTVGSVLAIVDAMMNTFLTQPKLTDMLSGSTFDLRNCVNRRSAVYIILPDERTTYHFIASMFIKQFYETAIIEAQRSPGRQLEVRMNFVLDEFSNLPSITDMASMITAARSRNIRFYLFVQSQCQLLSKYGEDAHTIKGNCNNWIFLNSRERDLLEELERLCGECIYEGNIRRNLISVSELQQLRKEKGEALVLIGRNAPYITRLYDIDEYPWEAYPLHGRTEYKAGEAAVFCIEEYVTKMEASRREEMLYRRISDFKK